MGQKRPTANMSSSVGSAGVRALSWEYCWAALLARDRSMDGRVYYSVRTTGVYCRPSCPSRRPRSEHVRFYASAAEAE